MFRKPSIVLTVVASLAGISGAAVAQVSAPAPAGPAEPKKLRPAPVQEKQGPSKEFLCDAKASSRNLVPGSAARRAFIADCVSNRR